MNVTVTDKTHVHYGKTFEGRRIFFDYQYTGNSPDVFQIITANGKETILSTQIDADDYERQEIEKEMARLGAKAGDVVKIIKSGSGSYSANFEEEDIHVITTISPSGHVTFDEGEATIFRPIVQVISQ